MSRILVGDALEQLRTLPDESVHCCVTSPPYWGLRDYGVAGQLGLESTPVEYLARMVAVFEEVRRVLRSDGTAWVNMGDCYATGAGKVGEHPGGGERGARWSGGPPSDKSTLQGNGHRGGGPKLKSMPDGRGYRGERLANGHGTDEVQRVKTRATRDGTHAGKHTAIAAIGPMTQPNRMPIEGLKPKDLVGMPWRLAFALQAAGWYLRADIVWHKPAPMPESVRDRPTKAHEYLFLLSKRERYFYDGDAIREPDCGHGSGNVFVGRQGGADHLPMDGGESTAEPWEPGRGRNKRSVWTVASEPFAGAHFATFPRALVRPCILAGCPRGGVVLDPFLGSGTTAVVCDEEGRDWIGIELNPEYAEMARRRLAEKQETIDA